MLKKNVVIGQEYRAKVSGQLTTVRIVGPSPYGGWNALNLATGRYIHIKTAGRLRKTVNPGPNVNNPDTVARLANLRRHPDTCPVCQDQDLSRAHRPLDLEADVVCNTCNAGWTERYRINPGAITEEIGGVAFDSGAVATA